MTPEQTAFIDRRRRQIRAWPWLASLLLLLLAGAYAWLWMAAPHNLDPGAILDEYNMRRLADQELILLAARGSMAMIACGLAVLVLVIMASLSLWNEHRLIRLLEEVAAGAAPGVGGAGVDDAAGTQVDAGAGPQVSGEAGDAVASPPDPDRAP